MKWFNESAMKSIASVYGLLVGLPIDAVTTTSIMQILSILMIVFLPIAVLVGFANDIENNQLDRT